MTGFAPVGDRFFDEPSLGVMLCQEFGLALDALPEMGFERSGDPRVQFLTGAGILHKRVLEQENSIRQYTALEH
jgi:hypothetical protein